MSGKYDEFINMTLDELKDEYYMCKDKNQVKRNILKKIIKERMSNDKNKQKNPKLLNYKNDNEDEMKIKRNIDKSIYKLISLKEQEEERKIKKLEPLLEKRGNMEQYWESNQNLEEIDSRFIKEINTDYANNKLMERLNCELDFRIYGDNSKNDIIKPYSNKEEGNFKDFEKYSIPTTTFNPKKYKK